MSDFLSNLIGRSFGSVPVQPRLPSLFEFSGLEKGAPITNTSGDIGPNRMTAESYPSVERHIEPALAPKTRVHLENNVSLPPLEKPLLLDPALQGEGPVRVAPPVVPNQFIDPQPPVKHMETEKQPHLVNGHPKARQNDQIETDAPDIEKQLPVVKTPHMSKAFEDAPDTKRRPVTELGKNLSSTRPFQQQGILNGLVQLPRPVNPEKSGDAEPDSSSSRLSSTEIFPGNTVFPMARPRKVQGLPFNTMRVHETTEPTVHVSIGRVEIRATPAPPQPTRQSSKPRTMTLEDYLQQRSKR